MTSPRLASLVFAVAGIVIGITNSGINFFILIYYDQVLHLRPALAGLAVGLALVVDGVADPLVGWLTDHWRSRLGRRHPFLLAAILPMSVGYWAIWSPPVGADRQWALFTYLLCAAVLVRLSITLFDVPVNALIPELTQDYDRRTAFASAKTSLNWMTANVVGIVMYGVFLADPPGAGAGAGILLQAGYQRAAIWLSGVLLLATVAVPALLARSIPMLRERGHVPSRSARRIPADLLAAYGNPSVIALLASAFAFAAGVGMTQTLWIYFLSFFWRLGSAGVNAVQLAYLAAALFAWWALPALARGRDKKHVALRLSAAFWIVDVAPIALRLAGAMPAPGSPALVPALVAFGFADGVLFNMVLAIVLSMLTDAVEDNLLRTGRREEGVVLAGQTLVTKASTALGTMLGAGVLTVVRFPHQAAASAVPESVIWRLGMCFVPTMWMLGLVSTWCLTRYRISRDGLSQVSGTPSSNNEHPEEQKLFGSFFQKRTSCFPRFFRWRPQHRTD